MATVSTFQENGNTPATISSTVFKIIGNQAI
jgi:hypothetical protein